MTEIEDAYQSTITTIARTPGRPVYADITVAFRDRNLFTRYPQGILYRITERGIAFEPKEPKPFSIGEPPPELLDFDYSLKKQIDIVERMSAESQGFWEWWKESRQDTSSSR